MKKPDWRVEIWLFVRRSCGHETKCKYETKLGRLKYLTQTPCDECK